MLNIQDLLTERREVLNELRQERDLVIRAVLQYRIDQIDREIGVRTENADKGRRSATGRGRRQ